MNNRREYQGEQLKTELMNLRNDNNPIQEWPWQHPFTNIHASALHEAGHAVIAVALGRRLYKLTVLQDATGGGAVERELREGTPKEIVEEIFIAYAGYEAASLYHLETDDVHDQERVEKLKSKQSDLATISEDAARSSVRRSLKALRTLIEDVAVPLFTHGEMTGEDAANLITKTLPHSEEAVKRLRDDIERLARKKPVLILGWGSDGCQDVQEIEDSYGQDQSLCCVKAPHADSREVLHELEAWLTNNPDAQILYLGAHGTPSGLQPTRKNDGQITYSELGKTIDRSFCGEPRYLTMFLGACQSQHAAAVLKELDPLPINFLITFSGKAGIEVIREALGTFLQQGDLCLPGKIETPKPIDFIERDIEDLLTRFPSVRIYYRPESAAQLTKVSTDGVAELGRQLGQRGRVRDNGSLMEAARNAMKSDSGKGTAGAAATPPVRLKVGTRTIGPRPPKKKRPRKRK